MTTSDSKGSEAPGPLSPAMRAALDSARAWDGLDPAFDDAACARVLGRVRERCAEPPASTPRPGRTVLLLAGVLMLLAGAGALAHRDPPSPSMPAPAPSTSVGVTLEGAASEPPHTPEPLTIAVDALPSAPSSNAAKSPRPQASAAADGQLAAEYALVDSARNALVTSGASAALGPLQEHARRFPGGQLAPERESLWIEALVALGDLDAARARADSFRQRYPAGLLVPAVRRALAPEASDSDR